MKKSFKLTGLDCAHCAAKIEGAIAKLEGVTAVSVNFLTQKLTLEADDSRYEVILAEAKKLIHKVEPEADLNA